MKYYAVRDESHSVIAKSWEECQEILKGCKKPSYKSFKTHEEAEAFLNGDVMDDGITAPKAYIDGSYDAKSGSYSFGGILIVDGTEYPYKKKFEADSYSKYRNVAGEIRGAGYVINYCLKHGMRELHVFYDYEGIEAWYSGRWKANSEIAEEYVRFADSVRNEIHVVFHKIKSHTNNHYNEMADHLAKEALGL